VPSVGAPTQACATDSSYVSLDYDRQAQMLFGEHYFDGRAPRRFGLPVTSGSYLRISQLSIGPMLCHRSTGRIWFTAGTGELLVFAEDGGLLKRYSIPEFVPGQVLEREGTIMRRAVHPDSSFSRIPLSLVLLRDSVAVFQLGEYIHGAAGELPILREVVSIIFDPRSARRIGRQTGIPHILGATEDRLLLTSSINDEPVLRMVTYELVSSEPRSGADR
jgi:hypothetical protein